MINLAKKVRSLEAEKAEKYLRMYARKLHHNYCVATRPDEYMLIEGQTEDTAVHGKGQWKHWAPGAVLRCAFAAPQSSTREVASKFQHASHKHLGSGELGDIKFDLVVTDLD